MLQDSDESVKQALGTMLKLEEAEHQTTKNLLKVREQDISCYMKCDYTVIKMKEEDHKELKAGLQK